MKKLFLLFLFFIYSLYSMRRSVTERVFNGVSLNKAPQASQDTFDELERQLGPCITGGCSWSGEQVREYESVKFFKGCQHMIKFAVWQELVKSGQNPYTCPCCLHPLRSSDYVHRDIAQEFLCGREEMTCWESFQRLFHDCAEVMSWLNPAVQHDHND